MRNVLLSTLILFFISNSLQSQSNWEWQHPLPQGNTLEHVCFINENVGWACGGYGAIIKTTDGGESWFCQDAGDNTNYKRFTRIGFGNENHGWAMGFFWATTMETTDGGNTWFESETLEDNYEEIYFKDGIGWLCSTEGEIFKSTDEGTSWVSLNIVSEKGLKDVYMLDENSGWACGYDGQVYKTSDAWANYETIQTPHDSYIAEIYAINNQRIIAGASKGKFYTTLDGGTTWNMTEGEYNCTFGSIYFFDENKGYIAGNGTGIHALYTTSDGGESWSIVQDEEGLGYGSISFINESRGFLVGEGGMIKKTTDGGNTWVKINNTENIVLNDIYFTDEEYGWACGHDGMLLNTTNGGQTWVQKAAYSDNDIYSIFFLDKTYGFITAGNNLCATTDGGESWDVRHVIGNQYDIYFSDINNGVIAGDGIRRTTDGGEGLWTVEGGDANIKSMFFLDQNIAWAVGMYGAILKTTDGGNSWEKQDSLTSITLNDVCFRDENIGIAVGGYIYTDGVILRTSNGGEDWESIPTDYKLLTSVVFTDNNTAYTCTYTGEILKTTDAGATWEEDAEGMNGEIRKMFFVGDSKAWIIGRSLSIKHWDANNVKIQDENTHQKRTIQSSNYPNPFSDYTKIEYNLVNSGQLTIKLYDINGGFIDLLVDGYQEKGNHFVLYDGSQLKTGAYYLEIQCEGDKSVRKIINMK